MRISVLMGIYNCADTLPRALDSLLAQTYKEWKCIMCDDGSDDNTYIIAGQYADKYPNHFLLIKNDTNQGLNITLNHCLEFADTEYIARMDGDDISLPERFEKEINFLDQNKKFDIVSSTMIFFDEQGDFRTGSCIEQPTKENIVAGSAICHAPCMIRTNVIQSIGGYSVGKKYLRVEDVDLWIKLYSNGSRCYNFSTPLYKMQDDRNATERRKFIYRIYSTRIRLNGCRKLKLKPIYYLKAFRPIAVGLLPRGIYNILHKNKAGQS